MWRRLILPLLLALPLCASPAEAQGTGSSVQVFGPKKYVRTTGAPNQYTDTFTVPGWIVSPYKLHIQNGEPSGTNRVSAATITINGTEVAAAPSDFNQNVATLERNVTLTPQTTLRVTLDSKPGSYLIINLGGASADHTPPVLAIAAPADGKAVNTATPAIGLTYSDPVGAGEPAASGVDITTLKVTLDGVDRTALFTRRSGDASATVPADLALTPGPHTITATVSDLAGNAATATSRFTVDLTPPEIEIAEPAAGAYLATATPTIRVTYQDNAALDLATLKVLVNGVDRTALFTKTATGATLALTAATALPQGANQISAEIRDTAGNLDSASVAFNVDLTPPRIVIGSPAAGSRHGSPDIPIAISYSDDQALAPASLRVRLDGNLLAGLTVEADGATGTASGVANGSHTLTVRIFDRAGNQANASVTFLVDLTAPSLRVMAPAPGEFVRTASPALRLEYSDENGVDTATLKVQLNGTDVTPLFTIGTGAATAELAGALTLPEGAATITAEIRDLTGNTGTTTSTFIVDTVAPAVAVTAPAGPVNSATPAASVTYSDSGSGIDSASLRILLDGADVTGIFAAGAGEAVGTLPALSDGPHTLQVTVSDRARNLSTATGPFVVDTAPPVAAFVTPADDSFLNTPAPAIELSFGDGTGSGVDPASLRVFLTRNGEAETEITPLFTIAADKATGQIPSSSALTDSTYHLRAALRDRAGNPGTARATFELDTVAPTYQIVQPAQSSALNVRTPSILITYGDDRSGVDPARLVLRIDGVDRSDLLVRGPNEATATLPAEEALEDGTHTLEVTVEDRAGNVAEVVPQTFIVDTVPPTITAALAPEPNAEGWNTADVTVTFTCTDDGSGVADCPAPVIVSTEGAGQVVRGTATDAAGNTAETEVTVSLSKTPPTITAAVSPEPNAAGWHNADVTVTFTCAAGGAPIAACPPSQVVSAEGAGQSVSGTITDAAGLSATATAAVSLDKTPPTITAIATPPPSAEGWNTADVTVTFTCSDALSGVADCPAPVVVSAEGAGQVIMGTATDVAGNAASASVTINLAKTPPAITAAVTPAPNAAGWNNSDVTVTFTCTPGGAPIVFCPPSQVVSTEGDNQPVTGTVRDAAGATASATATVRLDKTPPSITELAAPDRLVPGATGPVSVVVADNLSIASVAFAVDGAPVATLTEPPYRFDLTVPEEAQAGDTLTVTAVATDPAGNTATASRDVTVAAQGVVVGQVLSDATGLPLPGAAVQVLGGTGQDISDAAGRYSLRADTSLLRLRVTKPGMLPVEREVAVQPGVGTVAVDARLTAAASPVTIDSGGGTLTAGNVTVHVPSAGAVALTRLSGQGLPGLLPLGWSPVAAFDLSAEGASGPFTASFTGVPQGRPLHLVTYNTGAHAWTLVTPDLTSSGGTLSAELPAPGGYALVLADETEPPLEIPEIGQPLPGAEMVPLPPDAASTGTLAPPSLSPAGGTSLATLAVQSAVPLPSGTVIQAIVTEQYTPSSGEPISEAARAVDLVLYRHPAPAGAALAATFPVTPSRSFEVAELQSGKVHLDILAGREGARGQTGGSGAVVVQSGDATLAIAAGSLPEDTAISLFAAPLAGFLPTGNGLTPLAQYVLDFAGRVLSLPAQLSAHAGTAQPGDTLLLAQIQRFGGVPRLVAVSLAEVVGDRIVSQPYPGLPGITQGGEYVFYRLAQPLGFVSGLVSASGGPVGALVQTDALPFVAFSGADGRYTLPALAGTANVRATVPQTALLGTGSVAVTAGQTAALDLTLSGTVSAAAVTPPDGALGVDPSAGITITAVVALNPATVTESNIQLFQVESSGNQPVAVRFVLAQGNRQVSVFPLAALEPSTRYTLQVSGLATAVGGLVSVPGVTFTTRAVTPPNFNPNALVFAFPDADGNVAVSAPAGSFPPGTRVLIVNQTNGIVISLTVGNDGSVSGELPATIDDVLLVTLTAPDQSTTTFTRTQFVAPDGTVAVGSHGGTITGPGGVELRIPEGALDKGVRLKIEAFGAELYSERPEIPEGHFGGGLKVSSPDKLGRLNKEIDLAFPKPADAPDGSFYYVYRRLATADGTVAFEVIDQAFVEGEKVVTASAPFPGFITGMAGLANGPGTSVLAASLEENYFFLMWSFERLLVGVASQGVISGKVRRIVPPAPGQTDPTYVPLSGALVHLSDGGLAQVAASQADGSFVLWDRALGGGTRKVTAVYGNETVEATAFEVNAAEPDPVYFPNVQTYRYYKNLAKVNIAFPALTPPPPAPKVDIRLFTLDVDSLRVPATGVLQSGTSLVIAFKSLATVTGATVGGLPQNVTPQDVPDNPQDPLTLDARVVGTYTVGPPGVYTVVATALPPLGGPAITATRSFLAVAPGGNNGSPKPGAPVVIHTLPVDNAVSVATTTFPLVQFSEPVTQVLGNVTLADSSGQAANLRLIGVRADGSVANPVGPDDAITSLTLQPTTGLKFGETYTLTLGSGIIDQSQDPDQPPLHLDVFTLRFTTFGPQHLGGTAPFSSTRPVILGQRAYVAKHAHTLHSSLNIVDISDPANPVEVGTPAFFIGRAADIAGVELSPVTQGPLVAVATGVGSYPLPSNLWIFDVSNPDVPNRVAAVSATTSAGQDGTLLRIAMKGSSIYASTFPKGIQVIDVREAVTAYENRNSVDFGRRITTEGQGFGTEAVVNTISLTTGQGSIATMYDLEAGDFAAAPPDPNDPDAPVPIETLVIATGRVPLVVANPLQSGPSAVLYPPRDSGGTGLSTVPLRSADGQFSMDFGFSVALGSIQRTDAEGNSRSLPVALVAGTGTVANGGGAGTPLLAVVDLTDPRRPAPLGFLQLSEFASDVALKDSVALIAGGGKIRLVNLADPARPTEAGVIQGTFGDRLAISDAGVVVTASLNGTIGGVQTTVLGSYIIIRKVVPSLAMVDDEGTTIEPLQVEIEANGQPEDFVNARLTYSEDGVQRTTLPLGDLRPGLQTVIVPAGLRVTSSSELVEMSLVGPDGTETPAVILQLNSGASLAEDGTVAAAALSADDKALAVNTEAASASDAAFSGLSPLSIRQGSGPVGVTVTGAPSTQTYVRGLDSNWNALPAVSSGAGSFQITIPASLLGESGFLEVAPAQDDVLSIPLLVYDPSLPPVGSAPDLEVDAVEVDDDTLTPDTISVSGVDFVEGMKVVLGRGTIPGVALPTTLLGSGLLQAQVPAPFAVTADDLFVAVLTADGTALSSSIPYPRLRLAVPADSSANADREQAVTWIAPGVDLEEAAATAQFDPTEVGITSIQGDLVGTVGDPVQQQQQSLLVQGVNFVDGLVAKFRTWKGGQLLEKQARLTETQTIATLPAPPGIEATSPTELRRSTVPVPKEITDTPQKKFRVETATVQSGTAVAEFQQPAVVPFGGRRSFAVYKGPGEDYRILASSEATANPSYQAVTRAVVSISNAAPNSGGFNTIQLERETGDPQGSVRLRGTALTQLPCDEIRKISPQLPCDSTKRQAARLKAELDGKVVATRDVESMFKPLSSRKSALYPKFDSIIVMFADQFGVPPHFLKAQALQESDFYKMNFRFEFTSINVKWLAGDGNSKGSFSGSQPLIQTDVFKKYLVPGKALGAYKPGSDEMQSAQVTKSFPFDPNNSSRTQFNLGPAVKRTVGQVMNGSNCNRTECAPQVFATIRSIEAKPKTLFTLVLVHQDTVWQKAGSLKSNPAISTGAGTLRWTATVKEFAINYDTGVVTLGSSLQEGQQLVVRYWPVGDGVVDARQQQTVVPVAEGDFFSIAPNLNDDTLVKEQNKLKYNTAGRESLFDFLKTNIASSGRGFLTTPDTGDRYVEFSVGQNDTPIQPRDPRYRFITSQPYASSSYGLLQLTLLPFGPGPLGDKLRSVFDPNVTPIYQLLTQAETNFRLAAQFHNQTLRGLVARPTNRLTPCGLTDCNESRWQQQWYTVFNDYNPQGAGYNRAKPEETIIEVGASQYAPKEPE